MLTNFSNSDSVKPKQNKKNGAYKDRLPCLSVLITNSSKKISSLAC